MEHGSGTALSDVEVHVTCTKGKPLDGKSDASGRFAVWGSTGFIPKDACTLSAKKPGYAEARQPVEECSSQWSNCKRDLGRVELTPEAVK